HRVVYLPQIEITHHGRVSSRQNVGFTEPNLAAGFVRFLRRRGTPRPVVFLYKFAVTCDTPLRLFGHCAVLVWRKLKRQPTKAARTALTVSGLWHFLRGGMRKFWRA